MTANAPNRFLVLAILGVAVSGVVGFLPYGLSPGEAMLSSAICVTGLVPAFLEWRKPASERRPFPLMALTGIFYALFFGASNFVSPAFIHEKGRGFEFLTNKFVLGIGVDVLGLVLAGMVMMFVFWRVGRDYADRWFPSVRIRDSDRSSPASVLVWLIFALTLASLFSPAFFAISSAKQLLVPAAYLVFGYFCRRHYSGNLAWPERTLYFFIGLPTWFVGTLEQGSLTPILMLGIVWAAIYWQLRRRIPWRQFLVVGIFMVMVYPSLPVFRGVIWSTDGASRSTMENLGLLISESAKLPVDLDKLYHREKTMLRRVSLALPLAYVVERTPEDVSYWGGETYKPLLTGWVPRILWRDKPEERVGNEFAHRYELIGAAEGDMSVNVPWITEMYANFGAIGIIAGMAIVGLFLALLDSIFNRPGSNLLEQSVGLAILYPLWFHESNLSLMTGSILPLAIVLWLYFSVGLRVLRFRANHD